MGVRFLCPMGVGDYWQRRLKLHHDVCIVRTRYFGRLNGIIGTRSRVLPNWTHVWIIVNKLQFLLLMALPFLFISKIRLHMSWKEIKRLKTFQSQGFYFYIKASGWNLYAVSGNQRRHFKGKHLLTNTKTGQIYIAASLYPCDSS